MTWARLDDRLHGNRKMLQVWATQRSAVGLWLFGLTYAAQHETDGLVHEWFVVSVLPRRLERERDVAALVDATLWMEHEEGWSIPDFLEFNPSHEQLEERRLKERERRASRQPRARSVSSRWPQRDADVIDPGPTRPQTTPQTPRKRGANKGVCGEEPATDWARAHLMAIEGGGDAA